jgi:hypothetical protein
MQITGQVKRIHPIETVGANAFQKRKIWVETEQSSDYPQLIEVECSGKKVNVADSLNEGDIVELEANLNGRQWNDKVFNTISVWKVTVKGSQPAPTQVAPTTASPDDDLPF